ncbi:hypothetical protein Dimus_005034 [Dionaea muscipula]
MSYSPPKGVRLHQANIAEISPGPEQVRGAGSSSNMEKQSADTQDVSVLTAADVQRIVLSTFSALGISGGVKEMLTDAGSLFMAAGELESQIKEMINVLK